jgi:hypothetical protein
LEGTVSKETDRKDERSPGKNVQRSLANSRNVKVRNAVAEKRTGRGMACWKLIAANDAMLIVEWAVISSASRPRVREKNGIHSSLRYPRTGFHAAYP